VDALVPSAALSARGRLASALRAVLVAALVALFARAFVVAAAIVPSGSMRPTLLPGDRVLVDRWLDAADLPAALRALLPVRALAVGDVLWLRSPENPAASLVKRCAAVAGDRFGGRLLGAGEIAVLGDNRTDSRDSRAFGAVPARAAQGRVLLVLWSRAEAGEAPRWQRIGRRVR
jgi:signal peptidase I